MKYRSLQALHTAIQRGEINPKKLYALADGGEFTIYQKGSEEDGDTAIFDGYEKDALKFAAKMLGVPYEEP